MEQVALDSEAVQCCVASVPLFAQSNVWNTTHTPPEQLLKKIKCSGHMANAEGLQIQVETWGDMSQLFW